MRSWRLPRWVGRRDESLVTTKTTQESPTHLVEREEEPDDLALARLVLDDGGVEHCENASVRVVSLPSLRIQETKSRQRTANDIVRLESLVRIDLG